MKHLDIIMTEMFKRVGATYSPELCKTEDWYLTHEWTEDEENDFIKWLTEYLYKDKEARKEVMAGPTKNKKRCERVATFFVMWYGWKTKK